MVDRIRDITKLQDGEHIRFDLPCNSVLIIQRSGVGYYVGVFDPRNFVRVTDHEFFGGGSWDRQDSFDDEDEALRFLNSHTWDHSSVAFYVNEKALPMLRALFTAMSLAGR